MSFATRLARLLTQLRQLPPTTPSHLQHLAIRVERARSQAETGEGPDGLELLVRLRGRLHDLKDGLAELASGTSGSGNDLAMWSRLRDEANLAVQELDHEMRDATTAAISHAAESSSSRHSRTLSAERPRRVPSVAPASSRTAPSAELDAFLARAAPRPPPPSLSTKAAERAKALSDAYTLFLLSTTPESVLPPGQSLSSIFRTASRPSSPSSSSFSSRVEQQAHQAYFDSLEATLSSPSSSARDKRAAWARLCADLADAVLPLVPSRLGGGSVKQQLETTLRSAGNGEDWTLDEAASTLRAVLQALEQLCAPARDAQVRDLLSPVTSPSSSLSPSTLVDLVRSTLALAEQMSTDLRTFRRSAVAQLASEEELREVVKEETAERERRIVRELLGGRGMGEKEADREVRKETKRWAREKTGEARADGEGDDDDNAPVSRNGVASALIETLFEDVAVQLPSFSDDGPSSSSNDQPTPNNPLPPIFFVPSPRLFEIQNTFQAIVILACLVTVVGPPPSPARASDESHSTPNDYVSRLWTILQSEIIPAPPSSLSDVPADRDTTSSATRLAHLSDELIAYRLSLAPSSSSSSSPLDATEPERTRIRSAVERILRYEDPVYRLLKERLKVGVKAAFVAAVTVTDTAAARSRSEQDGRSNTSTPLPLKLRTGRSVGVGRRLEEDEVSSSSRSRSRSRFAQRESVRVQVPPIRGFERPSSLAERVQETVEGRLVGEVWRWMEGVWGGVLGWQAERGGV
ncbi:hypothetical protein JCM5296_005826 [Sporobolomyces johnsonii]